MQTRTSLVHGTGVDEAYGLIRHGCGGSVLSICVSRGSHEINLTAFRERYRPAETAEGSLTDVDWVRLKKVGCRHRLRGNASLILEKINTRVSDTVKHKSAGRRDPATTHLLRLALARPTGAGKQRSERFRGTPPNDLEPLNRDECPGGRSERSRNAATIPQTFPQHFEI
jgi:hypothetical protein